MIRHFSYFAALSVAVTSAAPFSVETMPNPPGVDPQIGGIDVLPDGKVAAVFHRGELMIFDPVAKTWSRFAEGLQEPLGIIAESPSTFVVMQRAELTRIKDIDGDGRADDYETVFDGFGMTGNYHEFAFGPAKGPDGFYYIALNVGSNGAGVREEIRGQWSELGDLDRTRMVHDDQWGKRSVEAGRMYSRVPYRGWIMKVSPDGKTVVPYACGFRSPDGIGFDGDGQLLVTDNQGDWRGTSPLYTVKEGGFYGHPASLVWRDGWSKGDPRKLAVKELDDLRTKETARFPQGELANSPAQPVVFPASWGAYAGQTLLGEMNQNRMVRFLPDEVGGFRQGTLIPMFDGTSLGNGNHRLAFAPDGSLWVGKTHLSWAGAEGLVKITPAGLNSIFTVTSVHLEKAGNRQVMRIAFSQPVTGGLDGVKMDRFSYKYQEEYGSPKIDEEEVAIDKPVLAAGGREVLIGLKAKLGSIHHVDLTSLRNGGQSLEGAALYYQATELP
jgi:glucose/arabinose dehydrogenase